MDLNSQASTERQGDQFSGRVPRPPSGKGAGPEPELRRFGRTLPTGGVAAWSSADRLSSAPRGLEMFRLRACCQRREQPVCICPVGGRRSHAYCCLPCRAPCVSSSRILRSRPRGQSSRTRHVSPASSIGSRTTRRSSPSLRRVPGGEKPRRPRRADGGRVSPRGAPRPSASRRLRVQKPTLRGERQRLSQSIRVGTTIVPKPDHGKSLPTSVSRPGECKSPERDGKTCLPFRLALSRFTLSLISLVINEGCQAPLVRWLHFSAYFFAGVGRVTFSTS